MKMTIEQFKALPKAVQEDVKDTLHAYEKVTISFEYGEYHVRTGTLLKNQYGPDHKVLGEIRDRDIFTVEELTLNYVNTFHSYPIGYKGKKDYSIFKDAIMNVTTFKYDNDGNIIKA